MKVSEAESQGGLSRPPKEPPKTMVLTGRPQSRRTSQPSSKSSSVVFVDAKSSSIHIKEREYEQAHHVIFDTSCLYPNDLVHAVLPFSPHHPATHRRSDLHNGASPRPFGESVERDVWIPALGWQWFKKPVRLFFLCVCGAVFVVGDHEPLVFD